MQDADGLAFQARLTRLTMIGFGVTAVRPRVCLFAHARRLHRAGLRW